MKDQHDAGERVVENRHHKTVAAFVLARSVCYPLRCPTGVRTWLSILDFPRLVLLITYSYPVCETFLPRLTCLCLMGDAGRVLQRDATCPIGERQVLLLSAISYQPTSCTNGFYSHVRPHRTKAGRIVAQKVVNLILL